MTTRPDPAERLLNLVIALMNTRIAMTKEEIQRGVAGYDPDASQENFDRMFSRDKELLRRELGIPIETLTDHVHGDLTRYRIRIEAAQMPPLELTPAEVAVLGVAAQLWTDAALEAEARRALIKLRALGYPIQAHELAGLAARVPGGQAPQFDTILDAIGERRELRFHYRAATTGHVTPRRVQPWRLRSRGQAWYLVGFDTDRAAPRLFRLSRIEGKVRPATDSGAFAPPTREQIADAMAGIDLPRETRTAQLALAPGRASLLRARGTPADPPHPHPGIRDLVNVAFDDPEAFAVELAGLADAVIVLAPEDLRDSVTTRLKAAAHLHTRPFAPPAPAQPMAHDDEPASASDPRLRPTAERVARLLAIVGYLADPAAETATITSLAHHFEVSPQQILQDVYLLWVTGLPGYLPDDLLDFYLDEETDEVALVNDQQVGRPLRLAPTEGVALLAALRALTAQPGVGASGPAESATAKLADALGDLATWAETVDADVAATPAPPQAAQLIAAVTSARVVEFDYVSAADRPSHRRVDPLQVLSDAEHWHLHAWDRDAKARRTFRLDRMLNLETTSAPADPHDLPPADVRPGEGAQIATLRVAPRARWLAESLPNATPPTPTDDGGSRHRVAVASQAWLRALLLGRAPQVWAEDPPEVREDVAQAALDALAAYGCPGPTP
ncbi:MAG: WYL domain-containing protein [Micrococcales bacterium]|nr:WYL domain-containing protein [Micrococcales bacterium]